MPADAQPAAEDAKSRYSVRSKSSFASSNVSHFLKSAKQVKNMEHNVTFFQRKFSDWPNHAVTTNTLKPVVPMSQMYAGSPLADQLNALLVCRNNEE
jgi:hypothetical protein